MTTQNNVVHYTHLMKEEPETNTEVVDDTTLDRQFITDGDGDVSREEVALPAAKKKAGRKAKVEESPAPSPAPAPVSHSPTGNEARLIEALATIETIGGSQVATLVSALKVSLRRGGKLIGG